VEDADRFIPPCSADLLLRVIEYEVPRGGVLDRVLLDAPDQEPSVDCHDFQSSSNVLREWRRMRLKPVFFHRLGCAATIEEVSEDSHCGNDGEDCDKDPESPRGLFVCAVHDSPFLEPQLLLFF